VAMHRISVGCHHPESKTDEADAGGGFLLSKEEEEEEGDGEHDVEDQQVDEDGELDDEHDGAVAGVSRRRSASDGTDLSIPHTAADDADDAAFVRYAAAAGDDGKADGDRAPMVLS